MANRIVLNPVSYHGVGAVKEIGGELSRRGFKRAFIASGRHVVKSGEIKKITDVLDEIGVSYTFYTDIKPNPTIENVQNGVKAFKEFNADCIIAVGGGSVMDTSKAIGIIV
ncbi:MAG: iron-containing alcohol dehydrogenase, partial [Clostridia bacterium]|nr:iron-containing alcohol dehydrogenase [Clostridia bacterium]